MSKLERFQRHMPFVLIFFFMNLTIWCLVNPPGTGDDMVLPWLWLCGILAATCIWVGLLMR